jgi:hypothetical protein
VFTARYALSPYIKQTRFAFKGLKSMSRLNAQNRKYNTERYQFGTSLILPYGKGNASTNRTPVVSDVLKHICGCLNKCFMSP